MRPHSGRTSDEWFCGRTIDPSTEEKEITQITCNIIERNKVSLSKYSDALKLQKIESQKAEQEERLQHEAKLRRKTRKYLMNAQKKNEIKSKQNEQIREHYQNQKYVRTENSAFTFAEFKQNGCSLPPNQSNRSQSAPFPVSSLRISSKKKKKKRIVLQQEDGINSFCVTSVCVNDRIHDKHKEALKGSLFGMFNCANANEMHNYTIEELENLKNEINDLFKLKTNNDTNAGMKEVQKVFDQGMNKCVSLLRMCHHLLL